MQTFKFQTEEDIAAGDEIEITIEVKTPDKNPKPAPAPRPLVRELPEVGALTTVLSAGTGAGRYFERIDFAVQVYWRSQWFTYFCGTEKGEKRSLYQHHPTSGINLVERDVQYVQAWTTATGTVRLTIIKPKGGYKTYDGIGLYPGTEVAFEEMAGVAETVSPYAHGDAMGSVNSADFFIKGNEHVREYGKHVDYRRHWFNQDGELCKFPLNENEEIYTIAPLEMPGTDKHIAMVGLFTIDGPRSANQIGGIRPVWAVSDDTVDWEFPFGNDEAFPGSTGSEMVLPTQLMTWGAKLLYCVFNECDFKHNRYASNRLNSTRIRRVGFDVNEVVYQLGLK